MLKNEALIGSQSEGMTVLDAIRNGNGDAIDEIN
jgi:hypothetical protein